MRPIKKYAAPGRVNDVLRVMHTKIITVHVLVSSPDPTSARVGSGDEIIHVHAIGGLPVASSSAVYEALQFRYPVRRTIY